jgi:hypothetical protein
VIALDSLYARCGYVQDYVMSRYYDDDVDGVTYVKFFAPDSAGR